MCYQNLQALQFAAASFSGIAGYTKDKQAQDIANANANRVRDVGFMNELAFRDQARRDIADYTARLAESNVDISTGSPLLLLAETVKNKELDAITIRRNAQAQSDAYRMEADAYGQSAPLSFAGGFLNSYVSSGRLVDLASIGGGN
jgi:hypothetical protein